MFLKEEEKSYNVSLANMKAETSSTFNKSQLYFYCFDVDCHNPPPKHPSLKVQIYAFFFFLFYSPRLRLTDMLSLKSQRYSVASVNVSVTTHFIWGALSSEHCQANQHSQQRERQIGTRRGIDCERVWQEALKH